MNLFTGHKQILSVLPLALGFPSKAWAAATLTTLHSFSGRDGAKPVGFTQGSDGNFYGTTEVGGRGFIRPSSLRPESTATNDGYGTLFKMQPDGTVTTLYSFTGEGDGGWPGAGLVESPNGTFYGMTTGGALADWGTVFSITSAGQLDI